MLSSGAEELVPIGVLTIEESSIDDTRAAVTVACSGRDRSARVAEYGYFGPYTISSGTNVNTAILTLVQSRMPGFAFAYNLSPTTNVTPASITFGSDSTNPWQDAVKLAEGDGCELYWDAAGVLTKKPFPSVDTSPVVAVYEEGEANLLVDPLTRRIDGKTYRNGVMVRGEAPWLVFPVQGEAWFVNGVVLLGAANRPANPRPERITDAIVGSDAQAQAVAAAKVLDVVGAEEEITFNMIPHPAHEPGDVIEIEAATLGGQARVLVDTLSMPQAVDGTSTGGVRRRAR